MREGMARKKLAYEAGSVNSLLDGPERCVVIVDLDDVLEVCREGRERRQKYRRVLKGRVEDRIWITHDMDEKLDSLAARAEVIYATERSSLDILGSTLASFNLVIAAGGFTIQDHRGISDPDWRSLHERKVRRDHAIFQNVMSEAFAEIGVAALRLSVIEQDGLPYALAAPHVLSEDAPLNQFLSHHPALAAFKRISVFMKSIYRRRHINREAAIAYLARVSPLVHGRPIVRMDREAMSLIDP